MIISRTPFRVSFFGGGTDYYDWYKDHGGQVLSCTIDKYCYISLRYLPPFFDEKFRIVWSKIEKVNKISDISHRAVREALNYFNITNGVEIHHDGDLPARTGLGSSSSFSVGLINCLNTLLMKNINKFQLTKDAIHLERDLLKEAVGIQDQIAVTHGGFNKIKIFEDGSYDILNIDTNNKKLEKLKSSILMFYTGISRYASEIANDQISSIPKKKKELKLISEMTDSGFNILDSGSDISDFGKLLHESWKIKRTLSKKITNSIIDDIYATALKSGATGGKLLGAGGGGFIIFYVPEESQKNVRANLREFLEIPFNFESEGSKIIFNS